MEIFRKYKTFAELAPGFLLEKEGEVQPRSMYPYNNHLRAFSYWLKETGRITMSDELIEICKGYGIDKADPDLYVFGKNKHLDSRALSENMLRFRFNKYRDKYGLSKDVKLYSFKHMGASYLVHSKIVDILELKEHLRHANLGATQHYVKKVLGEKNTAIKTQFPNPLKEAI